MFWKRRLSRTVSVRFAAHAKQLAQHMLLKLKTKNLSAYMIAQNFLTYAQYVTRYVRILKRFYLGVCASLQMHLQGMKR
jgi:hypothetical protein